MVSVPGKEKLSTTEKALDSQNLQMLSADIFPITMNQQ